MAETKPKPRKALEIIPDHPYNPVRVRPPEGQILIMKKLASDGKLDWMYASIEGYHFRCQEPDFHSKNEWDRWDLVPDVNSKGERVYTPADEETFLQFEIGLIEVGLFKAIYYSHLLYTKWEVNPDGTGGHMQGKDKDSPYVYWKHNLAVIAKDVPSKGTVTSTLTINLVVEIYNPYKAEFLSGGWEHLLDAAVLGVVRDHLSNLTIQQVQDEKERLQKGKNGGLINAIFALNNRLNDPEDPVNPGEDGFMDKSGIRIHDARFVEFKITSDEQVQDALVATQVAELRLAAAEKEGERIMTLGEAEAEAARLKVAAYDGNPLAAAADRVAQIIAEAFKKK